MRGPVAPAPPPNIPGSPYYEGQGGSYSAPAPAPREVWEDRWGAIASDNQEGIVGVSSQRKTKIEATQAAITNCINHGGKDCKLVLFYVNGCAAIAAETADGVAGSFVSRDSLEKAKDSALVLCNKQSIEQTTGRRCEIIYSKCSLPARIR
jgi:hypothetical protein